MWAAFIGLVLVFLALDLGVFHRKAHAIGPGEALGWSVAWIAMALLFNLGIAAHFGSERGLEFLTGYLIEKALSVDNLFVFAVLFSSFRVPAAYQHRVLFWGIVGALVMRALFILAGAAALERFHAALYVFGGLLIVTGIRLLVQREHEAHPEKNPVFRLLRRVIPATPGYHGPRLFVVEAGRRLATPLFFVLLAVELTDVVFAIDSIPAIFAVTRDPFIVFTSNIFAILGLRSLYFLLAGALTRLVHLKVGLALVLVFVGIKMTLSDVVHVPIGWSLAAVALLIGFPVATSLWATRRRPSGSGEARSKD